MENTRMENYTISESYELPSGAQIYDAKFSPRIELRSMTARDEMKRLNPTSTPLKTLADIIENCMIEKTPVHVYDMAVGDYEFLLHKLRTVTYGPEYQISVGCPHCQARVDSTAKLDEIEVKAFNIDEFEALRTFTLPVSNHTVRLNFQTPRLLDMIENKAKELRRRTPNADINFETYAQLLLMIDTVDEKKMSSVDLDYFINELPAKDMAKIINQADKLNVYIGLDNILHVDCPACGGEITTFFRFGSEFFRPTNI